MNQNDMSPLERFQRGLTLIRDIAYNDAVQADSPFWAAYTDIMWLARTLGVQINEPNKYSDTAEFNKAPLNSYFKRESEEKDES